MKKTAIAMMTFVALAGCGMFGGGGTTANGTGAPASNSGGTGAANSAGGSQASQQTASADGKPAAPDAGSQPQSGATPPAADQGSVQLDRAFMIGRWGDPRCTTIYDFAQDGRVTITQGGASGQALWNLDGSRLTLSRVGGTPDIWQLSPIDHNTVTVTFQNGSLDQLSRC